MVEQNEVNEAFDLLIKEIENFIQSLKKEVKEFTDLNQYEKAKTIIGKIQEIEGFKNKVIFLQKEWQKIFALEPKNKLKITKERGTSSKKLKKGLKTPDRAYFKPILESLVELGGKAKMKEVLDRVYEKMKDVLNDYDKEYLNSGCIRWENTAQWARNTMVKEGLLSSDSEWGVWEITDEGKKFLEKLKIKENSNKL